MTASTITLTYGQALGYIIVTTLFAAALGALIQAWWRDFLRGSRDLRSMRDHERTRNTPLNLRRWE